MGGGERKCKPIQTKALHNHVHRDSQVDQLNRFVESLGNHGYGREINVSRERATDKIRLMSCGGTKYRYLT